MEEEGGWGRDAREGDLANEIVKSLESSIGRRIDVDGISIDSGVRRMDEIVMGDL